MFPDSKIDTKYSYARTKTGAVVQSLAKSTHKTLAESTVIIPIQESHDNTGEGIFKVLDGELRKREISWENV
ncbi:hypothetical protein PR048_011516 [Dryococelus australis]|uniref:Uncharacterized protein n=1 Tax=Dryococelus australis TaxID=614101 RepID=A0ABQ9HLT9_9NEOP|nr:hypothetical protein PR048_011516 [Dryococelus australis]